MMNVPALKKILLIFSLVFVSHSVYADTNGYSAKQWLENMVNASSKYNYQGVMIYGNQKSWETLTVTHAVIEGQKYEKMLYLTGEPREFIRSDNQLMCIHSDASFTKLNKQSANNPFNKNFIDDSTEFDKTYIAQFDKQERIAGRMAQKIDLIPKDEYRYSYSFWLDTQTGLLLRSDMLEQKTVLERFQFASVRIGGDYPKTLFAPETQGLLVEAEVSKNQQVQSMPENTWQLNWLPAGFERSYLKVKGKHRNLFAERRMYTDGLNHFSVFVESSQQSLPKVNKKWGATSAIVVYKVYANQIYKITVVGELPLKAVKKIALSVVFDE